VKTLRNLYIVKSRLSEALFLKVLKPITMGRLLTLLFVPFSSVLLFGCQSLESNSKANQSDQIAAQTSNLSAYPELKDNLLVWFGFDGNLTDSHQGISASVIEGTPRFGSDRNQQDNGAFSASGSEVLSVDGIELANTSFSIQFWTYNPANWFLGQGQRANGRGLHIGATPTGMRCDYWGNDLATPLDAENVWTHWVITHDSTQLEKSIWRNGERVATGKASVFEGSGPLIIGRHFIRGGYFTGRLDDIAIWQKNLSAEEITLLYSQGKGLKY
jgi:Concanavalin A-like lectin/glucanases superfamily